ncbi:putative late blight resistance proteinR1B-16 [Sesamum alatum]|uniref:Late blight resistance proteinR1B-16 n=1 Tax=Sesamum alatum TaxID=300844 RepID=A0AAE1YCR9_9LAMI|nr:putative late blight resistance proteinR1B-16 [Sesamum alatum]
MAYNLESLIKILKQILHPHHHHSLWTLDPNKRPQIESLLEKACFLKDFYENSSSTVTSDKIQSLESRIREAAHDAEDILESRLAEQILTSRKGGSFIFSPLDLERVIGELDCAKEEMMTIMERSQIADSSSLAISSRQDPNPKNIVVGISEDLIQLKDRLTGRPSGALEVIPIVGMGGIGKTTLARNVYDDPSVISYFDIRGWATISQDYNMRKLQEILVGLLGCVTGKHTDEMLQESYDKLALLLHKTLKGRRYLIVLDDMWDVKPWDDTRRFFPDDNNGSRIIVTTRESSVVDYTSSGSSHHQMNLLKDDESWNLLCQKVFAPEETCSPELEKVGKIIAKNCRGLPLAIHVIGGILSQTKRSQAFWEQLSYYVSSTVADQGEQYSNILSLSYNHLPDHLKPCFLYMGAFPEDYEIRTSKLIKLWVAEGFVRPISDKSLEEAAEIHLKALVDRNLIYVRQQETKGNVKSYSIHDLLRDLCVRKAREEKFLFVNKWACEYLPNGTSSLRRVCSHWSFSISDTYGSMELMRLARSFLFIGSISQMILSPVISELRLLRVLDILDITFYQFPEEILQLVNLRYLALSSSKELPSSISKLWNLQTLIAREIGGWNFVVTPEILDMTQLRHIKFRGTYVWYDDKYRKNFVVQDQLQSLSTIAISRITDRVLETIPNLKKLGIMFSGTLDHVKDLSRLHKLHKLKCSTSYWYRKNTFLSLVIFPPSLKKLTLSDCRLLDPDMNEIGKLPNLEILKLRRCDFESLKWEADEGEFCQLQFLLMEKLNLVNWSADDTHFPRLQYLVIRHCSDLKEIPLGIGDIPTLEMIEVHECSPSAVASAREIQEAQLEIGNDGLQVRFGASSQQ